MFGKTILVNHGIFLKRALEDVNYIDEDTFRFYYADGDLCLRISQKGYEIIESPDYYIEHYAHANIRQRKKNAENVGTDKEAFFNKKWSPLFKNINNKENVSNIKEYDDVFNTARAFKRARPIEIYRIKSYLKEQFKKRILHV